MEHEGQNDIKNLILVIIISQWMTVVLMIRQDDIYLTV